MDRSRLTRKRINLQKLNYLKIEMFLYTETKQKIKDFVGESTRVVRYMSDIVSSIEKALNLLERTSNGKFKRKVIEDIYINKKYKTYVALAQELNLHINTIRYYEFEYFYLLASCLGVKLEKI